MLLLYLPFYAKIHECTALCIPGYLKVLSTGGAKGILCRVMTLKNLIVAKGSWETCSSRNFEF